MKRGIAHIVGTALLILVAMPYIAFAAINPIKSNVFDPTILNGPLVLCVGSSIVNNGKTSDFPVCSNICDLVAQVANVIYFSIAVVLWIITPIMFLVGGIMIMIGGGNPGKLEAAKKTLTGTLIGVLITLCAWLIVYAFVSAIGNLGQYVGGFGGSGGQAVCNLQGGTVGGSNSGVSTGN